MIFLGLYNVKSRNWITTTTTTTATTTANLGTNNLHLTEKRKLFFFHRLKKLKKEIKDAETKSDEWKKKKEEKERKNAEQPKKLSRHKYPSFIKSCDSSTTLCLCK